MPPNEPFHSIFRFLLAGLATWRLAFMLVRDDGPGDVFVRLRKRLGGRSIGKLLSCVRCVGVWVGLPLAFFVGGTWIELVLVWLALAGVAALIDEWTKPPFIWQEDTRNELLRPDSNRPAD